MVLTATSVYGADPSQANIPVSGTTKQSSMSSNSAQGSNITQLKYKENEIIVKYKKNISLSQIASSMGNMANINIGTSFETLGTMAGNVYTVLKSKTLSTEELLKKLNADPTVEYAEPNYIYYPSALPNDPQFNKLWGQHNTGQEVNGVYGTSDADIDAPEAWEKSTGSNTVVIAVIDTGVDYNHEDLAANMWINEAELNGLAGVDDDGNGYVDDIHGWNAVTNTGDPMDQIIDNGGHGTHVAGTIAAVGDNAKGVVGVSWKSKIMALKFLSANGGYTDDAIKCLNYMISQKNAGVNIVASNNSWGGGGYSTALKDAIAASSDAGILFIAAAGNGGSDGIGDNNDNTPHYPSSYDLPGIISVSASDQNDNLAEFSNFGVKSIDLTAPGTNILSTVPHLYTPKFGDIFYDDMESGSQKWTTGGTSQWGISDDQEFFENINFPVPSPTHFWSDSPSANYPSNGDWWVAVKDDINLSSYSDEKLFIGFGAAIWLSQNSDGSISDYAWIEVSKDAGVTWFPLYNLSVYARYWYSPYIVEIPDAYKTENFRFRFRMKTTDNDGKPGWLIDNIGIGIGSSTHAYEYKSGTSMATPQVTGAIALSTSLCPAEEINITKNRVLNTVDTLPQLGWKVLSGGRLNVDRLLSSDCNEVLPQQRKKYPSMSPVYYLLGI